MSTSDIMEDDMVLKEASNQFVKEFKKTDKYYNSPVRSKYLSQNFLENYLFVEGICKNLFISNDLRSVVFCGIKLSPDSMKLLN